MDFFKDVTFKKKCSIIKNDRRRSKKFDTPEGDSYEKAQCRRINF